MGVENIWRGGRLRTGFTLGVPAGIFFAVFVLVLSGSALRAVVSGASFAVLFGGAMALLEWRSWRGAGTLTSTDRLAVVRAVRLGEQVSEPRLAPAVIDFADVVLSSSERDRRLNWVLLVFAAMTAVSAAAGTIAGSTRREAVFWPLTALWVLFCMWLPKKRARAESKARQAASRARRIMDQARGG
jgi:hypothetical protein